MPVAGSGRSAALVRSLRLARTTGPAVAPSCQVPTRSDADGRFVLTQLRPDMRHTLFLRAEGHATMLYDFPAIEPQVTKDPSAPNVQPGGTVSWSRNQSLRRRTVAVARSIARRSGLPATTDVTARS